MKNISCVEEKIVSVSEIFRLQGANELKEAKKYLPKTNTSVNAIILAASQGDLGEFTAEIPKTLLKMKDEKTILGTQLSLLIKLE